MDGKMLMPNNSLSLKGWKQNFADYATDDDIHEWWEMLMTDGDEDEWLRMRTTWWAKNPISNSIHFYTAKVYQTNSD